MGSAESNDQKLRINWVAWVAVVISLFALSVSVRQANTQEGQHATQEAALATQGAQLKVQESAHATQETALAVQGEQLKAQQEGIDEAQARWYADGSRLETHIAIVGEENSAAASSMGSWFPDSSAPDESSGPSLFLDKFHYDSNERFYLRVAVRNLGRGPGLVTGIYGSLTRPELPVEDDERNTGLGTLECSTDTDADAVYAPCSFPLQIDAPGLVTVRTDISDYLKHDFGCAGEDPGEIDVRVRMPDDDLGEWHRLTISNYRQCAPTSLTNDLSPYSPPTKVMAPPQSPGPPITLQPIPESSPG